MSEPIFEKTLAHCNHCLRKTKHFIVAERINTGEEVFNQEDPNYWCFINWKTTYRMLECCGCEHVLLHKEFWFSEADGIEHEYYPPQISRSLPKWRDDLPEEWVELLREVYAALHADSRRLALMGARALVDLYMTEQLGDIGGFAQKLKKLENDGLISKPNKAALNAALEVGHAAAHRGHKARAQEVNQVMDIVENLLQNYVFKDSVENLKAKTPVRVKDSSL